MFANGDCCPNLNMLVRLYVHEAHRVYGDKLVSFDDLTVFYKMVVDLVKKSMEDIHDAVVFEVPNVFFHFVETLNDAKYMPCNRWAQLNNILREAQIGYNELIGALNLVLFEDAMAHVCR